MKKARFRVYIHVVPEQETTKKNIYIYMLLFMILKRIRKKIRIGKKGSFFKVTSQKLKK